MKNQTVRILFAVTVLVIGVIFSSSNSTQAAEKPNILFVLTDQWRADALGYAGDPNVKTPNIDRLAARSVNFAQAVSGCPVCCPFRASLMTGQRPLTHGIFLNDLPLPSQAVTIAERLGSEGYATGYIGKWHLDGHGRSSFIPRERRQGFGFWRALECTHNYNRSFYYADGPKKLLWEGYDAFAQTREARQFLSRRAKDKKPFLLFVAFGSPHNPYHTAPQRYRNLYKPESIKLRPNIPAELQETARKELAGYYAHCTAVDDCWGDLSATLKETGLSENTIVVFTSDHGDMLRSQGLIRKQKPWDESIRVPLLVHFPRVLGKKGRTLDVPINSEDLMPTLLGLCNVTIPKSVEGIDFSGYLRGGKNPSDNVAVITCPSPFGEWQRARGGKEYRGIRTLRYTYVRDLDGPWLLYDNQKDRFQQTNLCNDPHYAELQKRLDGVLQAKLTAQKDEFLAGTEYIKRWGYTVNERGTVSYTR